MDNLSYVKERFEGCFDVKYRDVKTIIGDGTLVFIDDLCNGQWMMEYLILPLRGFGELKNTSIKSPNDLLEKVLDISATGMATDLDDALMHVLSGDVILILKDFNEIIFCEVKNFPRRGIGIPETEAVLKGPREGFNELIVDNVALIRRRVKNPDLKFETVVVGEESQTAVAIAYIKGIAPDELVNKVKDKLKNLDLRFVLDSNYIEANLKHQHSFFDTVGYTEKPDEVAAKIFEGRIGILVDGTPFVITVPYFFLENFQMPDDYYINRYYTNFNRILRWFAFLVASFLPGLYVAIITYHFSMIPSLFVFRLAVSRAGVPLPTVVEVFIMIIAFQLIKEAGLRLPHPIGGAMSIVSALILGDAAVGAGIASRITIIVVAVSTLSYFLIPKVYGAVSFWSIVIMLSSSLLGIPGFLCASLIYIIQISELESVGYPFLFPLGSLSEYRFRDVFFRGKLDRISRKIIGTGGKKDAKNKRRKVSILLSLLLLPLLLTGCFDYHDINKVTFPTSIIFDVDDLGQEIVYLDCIKPYRSTNDSSDKGRRIIYKGEGKTALEALNDINRASSFKLDYSQTRGLYFLLKKASRKGIKKFLDLINNNSEFSMKPSAFVYYGDVDELLKTVSTDEEYLGLFLNDLMGKAKYNPRAVRSNINYYLSNILMGSNTALLTSISLKDNAIDKKIEIQGSSVFKDNVLVERIDMENSLIYNIIMGNAKSGTLDITNPQSKENFITLQILDSSMKDKLEFQDGKYKLIKDVNVEVSVSEVQGKLIVDDNALDYIKANEEAYIKGYAEYLFNKYKEENLDIFDIHRLAEMYYPNENIDNPLSVTEIEVNTNLIIKGTGVAKDSL